MEIKDIPLIIPNFNQLTYLRNLINWWKWYYPNNPVYVVDNGSDYKPLLAWSKTVDFVSQYPDNDFIKNLNDFLDRSRPEYYIISDCDIMPAPNTPPNFLEIFKSILDSGFHHVGFDLITNDIPEWNKKAGWIQGDERELHNRKQVFDIGGKLYEGWRAPIDSTFCLFKRENGGWESPMRPEYWDNSIRIFNAFHLPFYLHPDYLNDEMKHYYATCLRHDVTKPATGRAHFIPEK